MQHTSGQRGLEGAFILTLAFCIFEFIGGKLSASLALVADAGHMLTDLSGLGLALFAAWMAGRKPTPRMSYGFYRIEILAALINGALLISLAIFITIEAFKRLNEPREIHISLMLAVALAGLVVNLFCAYLLSHSSKDNINIKGAFFHVLGDTLSSLGTLVAGGIVFFTGWTYADPLVSFFISLLIVASAVHLLKDVVEVLLEATPQHIDVVELERKLRSIAGVHDIHDLHVWSLSRGKEALSAHLEVGPGWDADHILHLVNDMLSRDFGIYHTTLQIESAGKRRTENHFHPS